MKGYPKKLIGKKGYGINKSLRFPALNNNEINKKNNVYKK